MHCTERVYNMDYTDILSLGAFSVVFRDICVTFGRIGVPLFFMLSGYLLLDRDYSSSDKIFAFYKHNLIPLVITSEIWIVIYGITFLADSSAGYTVTNLVEDMLFLKAHDMGHMWYIPVITGIYIALPFVSNAVKKISVKALWVPLTFLFALSFVFYTLRLLQDSLGWQVALSSTLDTAFLGGVYGFYVLMGLMCKRCAFKKIPSPVLLVLGAAFFGITVWTLYGLRAAGYDFHLWYNYPPLLICSVCLFELFSRTNTHRAAAKKFAPAATAISTVSFGMYFLHVPILRNLISEFKALGISEPLTLLLFAAVVFILTALVAYILSKIPVVKRLLLNIK